MKIEKPKEPPVREIPDDGSLGAACMLIPIVIIVLVIMKGCVR